jgi:hypothetical protein
MMTIMSDREIAQLAIGIATGVYTEDYLMDVLGDESLVSKVMSMAGAGVASAVVLKVADSTGVTDIVESGVSVVTDTLGALKFW